MHQGRRGEICTRSVLCRVLYENGKLGAPDYKAAREWYLKAAKQGYVPAAYGLGNLYAKGNGVQADAIVAFGWFYIAASGDPRAKTAFDELSHKLSASDEAKAAKIAEKWLADNNVPTLRSR